MNRNYKILWLTFLVSNFGDWLRKLALPLLVFEKTGSPFHMATLYGISFLPWILFSLVGGILADKFKKVYIISICHLISLVILSLLIISFKNDNILLLLIYILTFLLSSTEPLVHPAFQSLLPQIVTDNQLSKANSGIQLIDNTLNLIGPMISGSVLLLINPAKVLWVNALTFLIASLLILCIKTPENTLVNISKKESLSKTISIGLHYVKNDKIILSGAILFFGTNFGIHIFQANLVYYITDVLGYTSFHYGLILSIAGVGAILGAILAPELIKKFRYGKILSISTMLAGLSTMLLSINTNYIYMGVFLGLSNMFGNINAITYFTLRQKVVKKEMLGRVVSITRMISFASIPLGAYLGGILISHNLTIISILILAGTIRFLAGGFSYFSPLTKSKNY